MVMIQPNPSSLDSSRLKDIPMATTVHRQESTTAVRKKHLLLAVLLLCCLAAAAAAEMGRSDADAIADLARSLARPPPSWTAGGEACSFEGISCSASGCVTAIDLRGLGLAGTLPSSLTLLTALESLQLSGNALSGAVPPLRTPTLTSLSLDGNAFTSLPKGFPRGLPALRHLNIDNLPLSPWHFPDAIAVCPNLRTLSACNASLAGPFPAAAATIVANLTWISTLRLANNSLAGEIPDSLTTLPKLELLDVSNNRLTGQLPKFKPSVLVLSDGNRFGESPSGAAAGVAGNDWSSARGSSADADASSGNVL